MKRVLMIIAICVVLAAILCVPVAVRASDSDISFSQESQSLSGQVMTIENDTNAYVSPDETSEVKQFFSKGDTVFVVSETEGWYQIFFKGEQLYIPAGSMNEEAMEKAQEQAAELAQEASEELKEAEKRDIIEIETLERQKKSYRSAMIWKIVIAVLVVLIIVVSVVIALKNKKAVDDDSEWDN